jgi:hypothetical protein
MSAVIFDPGAAPSLEEYLQATAGKNSYFAKLLL